MKDIGMGSKLALGTVQFGLDYGINNPNGKIEPGNVKAILELAGSSGIDLLDTAYAYGNSEETIGKCLPGNPGFNIISKFPTKPETDPQTIFLDSLRKLKAENLYGYLFHDISTYRQNPKLWDDFQRWKKEGKIRKAGFSVYFPEDLEGLIADGVRFDITQFPYSVFDRRFERIFPLLKDHNIEIHIRSVFLQGLVFKNPANLEPRFHSIRDKVERLWKISSESNIPISAICLNFALLNDFIDRVVIGVDSIQNLRENLSDLKYSEGVRKILPKLDFLQESNENIILPFNWK